MNENKDHKDVELRSEELHEVMGKIPPCILRWGILVLFIVVLAILTGSAFFKYPDVFAADMTLTGRYPVAQIVARLSGKISTLYVSDGQDVKTKTILAVIENPASTEDVLFLNLLLEQHKNNPDSIINAIKHKTPEGKSALSGELSLGDIQPIYTSFQNSLNDYDNYYSLNYYTKKINATREQIDKQHTYYKNQKARQKVMEEQYKLSESQYHRDSSLYAHGVISPSEHDNAISSYLQSRHSLESGYASLENQLIQIGEMETNLLDMELQQAEKESVLMHGYNTTSEQLVNAINSWILNYGITTPFNGKVTFTKYWNENQFVKGGENVFTVVPDEKEELIGKVLLPIMRSGKVKTEQKVIIRFVNYPDQEFGIVNGIVNSISLVPLEDNYQVEISLPKRLTTNYGKTLPVTFEMKASAEIVTENQSLLKRFLMPVKKMLKEGF